MPNIDELLAPFKKTAGFLADRQSYQMVPFIQWEVRKILTQPGGPPKVPNIKMTSVPGHPDLIQLIPGAAGVLGDLKSLMDDLARGRLDKLIPDFARLVPDTLHFVGHQLGLGLSLVALLDVVHNLGRNAEAVTQAYQSYFFDENGFTTLEGGKIAPPTFDIGADATDPTLAQIASEVRRFASHKTADQYIRDLIRITVESSCDELFGLRDRYEPLLDGTNDLAKQERRWFNGFASLAESTVMSAVEQAAQGVAAFSTNPLIAASLATFSGTAARKATQNAFLLEINL
jgi:hypothetical protein